MPMRWTARLGYPSCAVALVIQFAGATAAEVQRDPCQPQASCPNAARIYVRPPQQRPPTQQTAPAAAAPDQAKPPPPETDWTKIFLIFAGAAASAIVINKLSGDWTSPDKLDSDGPRFPVKQALGQFQVQGYAMSNWPVAIDLHTLPGTTNWIEISDRNKKIVRIPLEGEGRRLPVVYIPSVDWLASPRVTRFTIRSTFPEENGEASFQPLQVFGIAAGPRAVGSMKIAVTRFDPSVTTRPDEVRFALRADRQFDRSAVEVLRLPPGDKTELSLARDLRLLPLAEGSHDGTWRTMKQHKADRPGFYMLQARAWLVGGRNDERDWTGAYAPNFVQIP